MHRVKIALTRHLYSRFWIKQFYQLYRKREISLRPFFTTYSPAGCFYFEVDGKKYLIDSTDHKKIALDTTDYSLYFKANFSPHETYPTNVRPCLNGTTLTRHNYPLSDEHKEFDVVWLTGIGGGRSHKVAMLLALAALPLKKKLAVRLITPDDWRWAKVLEEAGVEVWKNNVRYSKWLEWNKKGQWCVLARGKHDCLSFKMIDYMSIGVGVIADYPPTTQWPIPIEVNRHFLSLNLSGPDGELNPEEFDRLCEEYRAKANGLLPHLQNKKQQKEIASNNLAYFKTTIVDGQAARYVLRAIEDLDRVAPENLFDRR